MKYSCLYKLTMVVLIGGVTSCFPEQDVEPVDPVDDNPRVAIAPSSGVSVTEGDVVELEITVDKMIQNPLSFSVVVTDNSTADDDDFLTEGTTLGSFSSSTTLLIEIPDDEEDEGSEQLVIQIVPDFHWDWQVHPEAGREPITITINDP